MNESFFRERAIENFKRPFERDHSFKPTHALFCEVNLWRMGAAYEIFYCNVSVAMVDESSIDNKFSDHLIRFATLPFNENFDPCTMDPPYFSDLSLCVENPSYVVIRLRGNVGRKWVFSRFYSPITVMENTLASTACEARWVNDHGIVKNNDMIDPTTGQPELVPNKRIAYFIYNPEKLLSGHDPNDRRAIAFNMHVEILGKNKGYVPIIIDPDVGHPGGGRP